MKTFGKFLQWAGPVVSIGYMTGVMVFTNIRDKEFLVHCLLGCVLGHVAVFLGNILFALGKESKREINQDRLLGW